MAARTGCRQGCRVLNYNQAVFRPWTPDQGRAAVLSPLILHPIVRGKLAENTGRAREFIKRSPTSTGRSLPCSRGSALALSARF